MNQNIHFSVRVCSFLDHCRVPFESGKALRHVLSDFVF